MVRMISALVLAFGVSSHALAVDENYYKLGSVSVTEVPVDYSRPVLGGAQVLGNQNAQDCNNTVGQGQPATLSTNPLEEIDPITALSVYLDQIVNLGKKIWTIVELGRPVSNFNVDYASALPKGLKCWSDLSGWQAPQVKSFKAEYKNVYGLTVVSYTYRVTATAGGSLDGAGKYVTHATFQPADIYVAWGYKFNASAEVVGVSNMGSKNDPIASLQLNTKWAVDTVLVHSEKTDTFHASGLNDLKRLQ